jgi:hypothetical protein
MTTVNVISLDDARDKKRDQTGWSIEEITQRAKAEYALYKVLAQNEPDELANGGDMKKILDDDDE